MTQFDEREKAFEKKFGMEEESEFKTAVRTARLFGLWRLHGKYRGEWRGRKSVGAGNTT